MDELVQIITNEEVATDDNRPDIALVFSNNPDSQKPFDVVIQSMISTSFWNADGRPISAEELLNNLFGELPKLFKDEEELRQLWSNPQTRKILLEN